MASPRKNAPALYELITPGGRRPSDRPDAVPEPAPEVRRREEHPEPVSPIGPGRVVRMPVGFFFIGVAAVIAAGVGGYTLGYMKKGQEFDAEERRRVAQEASQLREPAAGGLGEVNPDLLTPPSPRIDRSRRPEPIPEPRAETPQTPREAPQAGRAGLVIVGEGTPDPREPLRNYAIVSSLGWDRALALGEFLASEGLEVAILPAHNGRLHPVVSLRGLTREEYRSPERGQHERLLKRLGGEWAASGRGRKDFEGLYWARYD